MNSMPTKTWITAVALTATLALPLTGWAADTAPAAPNPETPKRPERPRGDRLEAAREQRDAWIKELGVTDEQRDKIRAAMKEQMDKGRELRSATGLTEEQRRAKAKELRDGMTAKM